MNKQIRKLAEQAGFYFYDMHNVDGQDLGESVEADSFSAVENFAKLIAAAERESCAQVCEAAIPHLRSGPEEARYHAGFNVCTHLAAEIRARDEK